jgi:hypothetical protein
VVEGFVLVSGGGPLRFSSAAVGFVLVVGFFQQLADSGDLGDALLEHLEKMDG